MSKQRDSQLNQAIFSQYPTFAMIGIRNGIAKQVTDEKKCKARAA
jgi:hypothetical protein